LKKNNRGFTLAELLIVVAIIAVLVAIAIPVFTNQLERSREATDAANIRSAYAEVMTGALTDGTKDITANVDKQQTEDGWKYIKATTIGGIAIDQIKSNTQTVIKYDHANGKVTIDNNDVTETFVQASTTTGGGTEGGGTEGGGTSGGEGGGAGG